MKNRIINILRFTIIFLIVIIIIGLFRPTWTPKIEGTNSISELRKVDINGTDVEVMIRGKDTKNPIIIFVHGGPCCSEIPYVRKYQTMLEEEFTIVHYDQRGSGKSYQFGKDYSEVTVNIHVNDLISLTEYIEKYLQQDQVILIGHSFGTYIGTLAVEQRPDLYLSYIGIGQMSDTIESEMDTLQRCIIAAQEEGNQRDVTYLESLEASILKGESITPRQYVRKYGFAARLIDENLDYVQGLYFGTEYNLLDAIGFYSASIKYQDSLIKEALENPISDIVTELDIPVYFVMGQYDGMTSPQAAKEYLDNLHGKGTREMVIFENSAHYPQFEEKERFYEWMCSIF